MPWDLNVRTRLGVSVLLHRGCTRNAYGTWDAQKVLCTPLDNQVSLLPSTTFVKHAKCYLHSYISSKPSRRQEASGGFN